MRLGEDAYRSRGARADNRKGTQLSSCGMILQLWCGPAGDDAGLRQGQPEEHLRHGAGLRGAVACQLPGWPPGHRRQPHLCQGSQPPPPLQPHTAIMGHVAIHPRQAMKGLRATVPCVEGEAEAQRASIIYDKPYFSPPPPGARRPSGHLGQAQVRQWAPPSPSQTPP